MLKSSRPAAGKPTHSLISHSFTLFSHTHTDLFLPPQASISQASQVPPQKQIELDGRSPYDGAFNPNSDEQQQQQQ